MGTSILKNVKVGKHNFSHQGRFGPLNRWLADLRGELRLYRIPLKITQVGVTDFQPQTI